MRTDDPVILGEIEKLEAACESLRRICGFPTLTQIANDSTKATFQCPECSYRAYERDDFDAHLEIEHRQRQQSEVAV